MQKGLDGSLWPPLLPQTLLTSRQIKGIVGTTGCARHTVDGTSDQHRDPKSPEYHSLIREGCQGENSIIDERGNEG